jgi:hypothetical protein
VTAPTTEPTAGPDLSLTATTAAVTAAYLAATAALRANMVGLVTSMFGAQGYRDTGADAYTQTMGPAADTAQHTMAAITEAYLTQLTGTPPVGIPADLVTGDALRGVDPAEVLRRPYEQLWTALSQGKTLEQAITIGQQRAESIALTNLQLAKTHTTREVLSKNKKVVGYRRVLTGPYSCGMCVVASSVRYHKQELMPIHPACDCAISPITGTEDPGRTINSATLTDTAQNTGTTDQGVDIYPHDGILDLGDLLEPTHRAIEDRFGRRATDARSIDYRKVILIRYHSEIGPVLTVAEHKFTKKQITTGNLRSKASTYGGKRT